jgi:hypothetical protein
MLSSDSVSSEKGQVRLLNPTQVGVAVMGVFSDGLQECRVCGGEAEEAMWTAVKDMGSADPNVQWSQPVTILACPCPEDTQDRKIAALKRYAQEFMQKQETPEDEVLGIAQLVSSEMYTSGIYAGIA